MPNGSFGSPTITRIVTHKTHQDPCIPPPYAHAPTSRHPHTHVRYLCTPLFSNTLHYLYTSDVFDLMGARYNQARVHTGTVWIRCCWFVFSQHTHLATITRIQALATFCKVPLPLSVPASVTHVLRRHLNGGSNSVPTAAKNALSPVKLLRTGFFDWSISKIPAARPYICVNVYIYVHTCAYIYVYNHVCTHIYVHV